MPTAEDKILDIIQLINSEHVGAITFHKLTALYGSAGEAIKNLHRHEKIKLCSRNFAEKEIIKAEKEKIRLISILDKDYPEALRSIDDAPPLLYAKGCPSLLNHQLSLAVVGARNASINGRKTASRISFDLTNNDVLIVSGLAIGIDSAAHKGAMYAKNQTGPTLAVLGTGVDVIYPVQNADLYEQTAAQGLIISEFPLGTKPQANNFPRRNRIVAGITLGTLVVEATLHSGSLITARLAAEQGKDIYAVPGSPNDSRSLGPNHLIKEGACLAENSQDILENLIAGNRKIIQDCTGKLFSPLKNKIATPAPAIKKSSAEISKISVLDYLNFDGVYVDEIIRESGISPEKLAAELLNLELEGRIEYQSGNKVALIK